MAACTNAMAREAGMASAGSTAGSVAVVSTQSESSAVWAVRVPTTAGLSTQYKGPGRGEVNFDRLARK